MEDERMKMLTQYVEELNSSTMPYDRRGKYVDAVWFFLSNAESIGIRGYNKFRKMNAEYLVDHPIHKEGVLHFLGSRGIGFNKRQVKITKISNLNLSSIDERHSTIINEFLLWLQNQKALSSNTLRVYKDGVRNFYKFFDQLTQENARRYISYLESKGFKPQTINLRITALEKLGDFVRKPIVLTRPKIKRSLHTENVPTEKEYRMICDYLKENTKMLMIVKLMATTGCRFSELEQFTYEQVSSGGCVLKGKGSKYRQFFFTKEMRKMAEGKEGKILNITDRGLNSRLKHIGNKLGIDKSKMHPHAFRHFFAKMYLKRTNDVIGLADLLGHGSVDTTRIYLQKSYDEQQKSFNRTVEW